MKSITSSGCHFHFTPIAWILAALLLMGRDSSQGATIVWLAPPGVLGNWENGPNWTGNIPPTGLDDASISDGGIAFIGSGVLATSNLGLLGMTSGSSGTVLVSGGTWTNNNDLLVGFHGAGTLNIEAGGMVSNRVGYIGHDAGVTGTVTVTGAGSKWENSNDFAVGTFGTGTLTIADGGMVSNAIGYIGSNAGSTGTVTVTGAGSTWTNNVVNVGHSGTGTLNIEAGGAVTSQFSVIGYNTGSEGTITVTGAGSTWTNNNIISVGEYGTGTLNIADGGTVTSQFGYIGYRANSTGTATVTGPNSTWTNNGFLYVGILGTGTLNIADGGSVSNMRGFVGFGPNSTGTATVTGPNSTWTISEYIEVGSESTGTLNIANGGSVSNTFGSIGQAATATGTATVTGTGSTWTNSDDLYVGNFGTGTLNIANGGRVNVGAGNLPLTLASKVVGTGTLNIGAGDSAGVLNASEVYGVLGTAILNFNHTDTNYYFTKDGTSAAAPVLISGSAQVNHLGSGTTILTGNSSYSGGTTITAGTLWTQNVDALGTGNVKLQGGVLRVSDTLKIDSLNWGNGKIQIVPGTDIVNVEHHLNNIGGGGGFLFDTHGLARGTYMLLTFDTTNFVVSDFTAQTTNPNVTLQGTFDLNLNPGPEIGNVIFTLTGATATGPLIQNSAPVSIPTFANFIVNGPVQTGGPGENNQVMTLTFTPGSSLLVFNTLTVTEGTVNLVGGSTLNVNGTLVADGVNVGRGGLLKGSGVIFGDVLNAGTVAPGNSPGTLTIIGNYTQTGIGTLQIEIASEKVFDRLIVSGTARLDGTLDIRNYHGNILSYGQQVPFLQAGKIVGAFDEILMPEEDLFRGRFLNAGHTGILLVAPTSYTLVAETPNQTRVAHALDRWIGIEDGDIGGVTLALDLLTAEQYPAAFEAIMPGYYESALSTGIELSQSQGQLLFQQLSSRRLGAQPKATVPAPSSAKGVKNVAPVQPQVAIADSRQWNGWMQGSGLFSDGGLSLNPGEDFDSGTFMVGADFAVSEHVSLGLFASYQEGWGDYDNGGDMDLESVRFGGYATFDFDGFYASAAVGGGTTDYSVERPIQWATLDRTARSDPDGAEFFTMLGTGYDFHAGNFTFGPSLSAQYTKLKLDEFTESGADSLDLRIRDAEEESLRTYLGGRIAYTVKVNDRFTVIPELRAFWEHEFLQGGENLNASLNGGAGPEFRYVTEEPGKDAMYVGAGLNFEFGENFTTSVYYHANFGRNDDAQHTVSVSANLRF